MDSYFLILISLFNLRAQIKGDEAIQQKVSLLFQSSKEQLLFHQIVVSRNAEVLPLSSGSCSIIESMYSSDSNDYHYGRYNHSVLHDDYRNAVSPLSKKAQFLRKAGGNAILTMLLLSKTEYSLKINYVLQGLVMSNDNPDFLLFFIEGSEAKARDNATLWTSERLSIHITSTLSLLTLTSILLYLDQEGNLSILCSHCRTFEEVRSKSHILARIGSSFEPDEVVRRWNAVHRNFDHKFIFTVYTQLADQKSRITCSPLKSEFSISEEDCVFVELQSWFNFTTAATVTEKEDANFTRKILNAHVGTIYKGYISSERFIRDHFLVPQPIKHAWISWGCSFNHYFLFTFVRQSHFSFLMILHPFGLWTWLALAVSFVLVATLACGSSPDLKFGDASFLGMSILLEQSSQWHLNRYRMASGVSALWILTTLFTANFYKTDLFSSITSPTLPTHPHSILDLENYLDLPIYTTTKHFMEGLYASSTLKDVVLIDMGAGLPPNNSHNQLRSRTIFLNGSDSEVVLNMSLGLRVRTDDRGNVDVSTRDYALIDYAFDGERVSALIQRTTDFIPLFQPSQTSPYITLVPWFGERNFIFNMFTQAIATFCETGHLEKWRTHEDNAKTVRVFEIFYDTLRKMNVRLKGKKKAGKKRKRNHFALVNLVPKQMGRKNGGKSTGLKGISLQNFDAVFIIFLAFCLVSIISFGGEVVASLRPSSL